MSINRYNPKRDANEKDIVTYLKNKGLSVERLNTPLDLLVGYEKRNYLVEVKMPGKKLNANQAEFVKDWQGQYIVLSSVSHAVLFADFVISNKQLTETQN